MGPGGSVIDAVSYGNGQDNLNIHLKGINSSGLKL